MSDWNGLPDQPEHSGWHWLAPKTEPDVWELHFWDQSLEVWGHRRSSLPEAKAKKYVYGEPVRDPSELAQMRQDERDRAVKATQEISVHYYALSDTAENDVDVVAFEERIFAADECASAIRALTDDEGKKS
ncbi:hypothetical protein [Komagataeibacter sp. FNDCF1]|uniref:hypothetical protein n=1 Tax=Komagataeibacter sp. FNDCF1 TaxID=2878681 RepID=UPI001E52C1F1|nr:hypothetical protein [Komagataeibacter sp. FNDCF1]MCE2563343.1 hypothetical protein [Komagataeibacter sp. FNDCF1]